ncbi:flagellar hook-length control protein FliK [Peptococcaceae bacterium 1198_IL3148]
MVTVNGNIFQGVNGKSINQSKGVVKEGDGANGDFLMALLAAATGQQTVGTDVTVPLLNGNSDQQQPSTDTEQPSQMGQQQLITDIQTLLTALLAQLKQPQLYEPQPVGTVPKQVDAALLDKLESLLSRPQPQLTVELKDALKQLQIQLQNASPESKSQPALALGQTDGNAKQPSQPLLRPIEGELLGNLEKLQSSLQVQPSIATPKSQLNQPLVDGDFKQQTAERAVKVEQIAPELPKAVLVPQHKGSTSVQAGEQQPATNQPPAAISQFVKPATERPVEQLAQPVVKGNEEAVQSANQQTTSNQSTLVNSKDQVQPEQMAGRLLNMVKEMATKQQPNQTTIHLRLNPEHLGEVTIRLTYNRGELNAQFYAATAHGKEALEAVLPQMREALYQQQVKLNDATVYLNNGSNQWLGGRQDNQGDSRGRNAAGYNNKNSYQPQVSAVSTDHNSVVVDDGLNILV